MKKYCLGFIILFFFLFSPSLAYAARSLSITSNKSALFGEEEMIVNVASLSGFTNGETIYIKGAFYQDGSTNYFGYSKNGESWIKNGDSTANQKKIKIGDWDGNVTIKTDFADSGYVGEGGYKLKLGFYYLTSGGNFSSVNWSSNSLDINISEPDPTATPTQVPTTKPEPTSVIKSVVTVKPLATATIIPTKKPLPLTEKKVASLAALKDVLGTKSAEKKLSPTPKKENILIKGSTAQNLSAIFILIGGALIMGCGILIFIRRRN